MTEDEERQSTRSEHSQSDEVDADFDGHLQQDDDFRADPQSDFTPAVVVNGSARSKKVDENNM